MPNYTVDFSGLGKYSRSKLPYSQVFLTTVEQSLYYTVVFNYVCCIDLWFSHFILNLFLQCGSTSVILPWRNLAVVGNIRRKKKKLSLVSRYLHQFALMTDTGLLEVI